MSVPVSKSQGLGVGGGNDETDSRGSQLLPSAVCQLPALPVVLLQGVAIAPGDQALRGTDSAFQTRSQVRELEALCLPLGPLNSQTQGVLAFLLDRSQR